MIVWLSVTTMKLFYQLLVVYLNLMQQNACALSSGPECILQHPYKVPRSCLSNQAVDELLKQEYVKRVWPLQPKKADTEAAHLNPWWDVTGTQGQHLLPSVTGRCGLKDHWRSEA